MQRAKSTAPDFAQGILHTHNVVHNAYCGAAAAVFAALAACKVIRRGCNRCRAYVTWSNVARVCGRLGRLGRTASNRQSLFKSPQSRPEAPQRCFAAQTHGPRSKRRYPLVKPFYRSARLSPVLWGSGKMAGLRLRR